MDKAIITKDMLCTMQGKQETINTPISNTLEQNWNNLINMYPFNSVWQGNYLDNNHFEILI